MGATLLLKLLSPPLQQEKQLPPLPDDSFEESRFLPEKDFLKEVSHSCLRSEQTRGWSQ